MPARQSRTRHAAAYAASTAGHAPRMGSVGSHAQVAEIQRSRLLAAAVAALQELGYERATVAHITRHARVSRRTFYELFANKEECVAAVLYDTAAQVAHELCLAELEDLAWRERIRHGLWVILCFLDREPALARVLVLHSAHGSGSVLEARAAIVGRLVALVDEGRRESARGAGCTELTAEGLLGATLTILSTRLARRGQEPLTELLGELAGLLVLPYLGATAARQEQSRSAPSVLSPPPRRVVLGSADPLAGLPMRLTYRTARVLEGVGEQPGASNRQVAEYAGISDQGQISKLLARLGRLGLIANEGDGHSRGEPNAWRLTQTGVLVRDSIARYANAASQERAA